MKYTRKGDIKRLLELDKVQNGEKDIPVVKGKKKKKKGRYNNKKVTIDGLTFDSKEEHVQYDVLFKAFGKDNVQFQVAFEMFESTEIKGTYTFPDQKKPFSCIIRKMEYWADFVVNYNGKQYIIDAKGHATDVFKLKAKCMIDRGFYVIPTKKVFQLNKVIENIKLGLDPVDVYLAHKKFARTET